MSGTAGGRCCCAIADRVTANSMNPDVTDFTNPHDLKSVQTQLRCNLFIRRETPFHWFDLTSVIENDAPAVGFAFPFAFAFKDQGEDTPGFPAAALSSREVVLACDDGIVLPQHAHGQLRKIQLAHGLICGVPGLVILQDRTI